MIDYFHLADNSLQVQVFKGAVNIQPWYKPKGSAMIYMMLIGGGGPGGAGFSGSAGTVRGGGGGGGSGSIVKLLIPAFLLPDTLYITAPTGGTGGTAIITTSPNPTTSPYLIAYALGGGAGGVGSASTPGFGALGGGGMIGGDSPFKNLGIAEILSGKNGSAAGAVTGAVGVANTALSSPNYFPLTGGAGGGSTPAANTNFAGGDITGVGIFPTIAGGTSAGGNGGHGIEIKQPFSACGGSGGGTNGASGVGGAGGNGAIGCGGGGGGGGVTGGAGGKGGDGLVIMIAY